MECSEHLGHAHPNELCAPLWCLLNVPVEAMLQVVRDRFEQFTSSGAEQPDAAACSEWLDDCCGYIVAMHLADELIFDEWHDDLWERVRDVAGGMLEQAGLDSGR